MIAAIDSVGESVQDIRHVIPKTRRRQVVRRRQLPGSREPLADDFIAVFTNERGERFHDRSMRRLAAAPSGSSEPT
ncbi:MAG TPA: hypothetical protein VKE51_04575 [Vicinamibacterales bacterium]|nr:hypothetical protein [Vicinamibacterales bacterium]